MKWVWTDKRLPDAGVAVIGRDVEGRILNAILYWDGWHWRAMGDRNVMEYRKPEFWFQIPEDSSIPR